MKVEWKNKVKKVIVTVMMASVLLTAVTVSNEGISICGETSEEIYKLY